MKFRPSLRDRRALFVLGSALAVYFLITGLVFPVYDGLIVAADSAVEKEDQLRRYRRAVVRKNDYGQLLREANRRLEAAEDKLISGENPSLASAELQRIVESVAETTGLILGPRNMSTARKKDEFFNEITMALGFNCTPGQLVRFFTGLRDSGKLVVVRSLQVSPLENVDGVLPGTELKKELRVNVTVAAVLENVPTVSPGGE